MTAPPLPAFRAAYASGGTWPGLVTACLAQLGPQGFGRIGFLYATDALASDLSTILTFLRERTRIEDWVGSIGLGVCAAGAEIFDEPALAIMLADLPPDSFQVFSPAVPGFDRFDAETESWLARHRPMLGVAHADPRQAELPAVLGAVTARSGAFLVGAVSSARHTPLQVAGRVVEGGLSGVLLADTIDAATGVTQGCAPIGPVRHITAAQGNVVMAIDERPALAVFKDDIGELLARDLRRVAGRIFAGFPIAGSDTADYLVRNLVAIDTEHQWLAVAQEVAPGDPILFCRRDTPSAVADLKRMLESIKLRVPGRPRGGLYFSCIARGPNLFASAGDELGLIHEALGNFPLVGFFGNGEISHDRLYAYTGVLTVFP